MAAGSDPLSATARLVPEVAGPVQLAAPPPAPVRGFRRAARRARDNERNHAFSALWTAAALSYCGDGVILGAAPLAAATLTSDPRLIAGLTVAATLPWALFSLVSGAVVDRVDRIRLMWRIDVLRAAVMAVPALSFVLGKPNIYLLLACFFSLGTAETFFANAAQAALPSVVPTHNLRAANGKLQGAELVLTQLLGPPLGGALISAAVVLPFAVDSASFLLSAVLLMSIGRPRQSAVPVSPTRPAREPLGRQIAVGMRWLWGHSQFRLLAILTGLVNLLTEATLSVLVIFSRDVMGTGPVGFGNLLAVAGLGGVVASVVGPLLSARLGDRRTLLLALQLQWVTQLAIWGSPRLFVVASALAVAAFGIVLWNVVAVSLRQTLVPVDLCGRVNSVYRFVAWGTIPLGAAMGGAAAALIGTRALFLWSGLLLGAVSISALLLLHPPAPPTAPLKG